MRRLLHSGITKVAILLAAVSLAGCASSHTARMGVMSSKSAALQSRDDVPEYVTIIHHGDGTTENLGPRKYSQQAIAMLNLFPISGIQINDAGYCTGITPALPPAYGVQRPTEGAPLAWAKFDRNGRLLSYEYANEFTPNPCDLVYDQYGFHCVYNNCPSPLACFMKSELDHEGNVINLRCECETVPD